MAERKTGINWPLCAFLSILAAAVFVTALVQMMPEPPAGRSQVVQLDSVPDSYPTADQATRRAAPIAPTTAHSD